MASPVIIECEQNSKDWMHERCGRLTASRIAAALAMLKRGDGETAARYNLKMEMACEIITGRAVDHYVSPDMERGRDLEDAACKAYEMDYGIDLDRVGFVIHPTNPRFGCSPDRFIGKDGMAEIKCPRITTHIGYLLADVVPEEYKPQMMWQMACCTDRLWNNFVSFCPEMPPDLQIFVKGLGRDDAKIAEMEAGAKKFLAEVDETIAKIRSRHA